MAKASILTLTRQMLQSLFLVRHLEYYYTSVKYIFNLLSLSCIPLSSSLLPALSPSLPSPSLNLLFLSSLHFYSLSLPPSSVISLQLNLQLNTNTSKMVTSLSQRVLLSRLSVSDVTITLLGTQTPTSKSHLTLITTYTRNTANRSKS